ncbi:histone deacetylase 6-like isoform X2 [Zophobas morio]|uniref:histone deacetylase 6-like isoform X2 n=1 Tax=Zophobas morio TaxID=2755281 RepID=UPI003083AA3F
MSTPEQASKDPEKENNQKGDPIQPRTPPKMETLSSAEGDADEKAGSSLAQPTCEEDKGTPSDTLELASSDFTKDTSTLTKSTEPHTEIPEKDKTSFSKPLSEKDTVTPSSSSEQVYEYSPVKSGTLTSSLPEQDAPNTDVPEKDVTESGDHHVEPPQEPLPQVEEQDRGDKAGRKKSKERRGRRESLRAVMARKKKEMKSTQGTAANEEPVADPYDNATSCIRLTRGRTGIVYEVDLLKHKCEWDDNHPECPKRLSSIVDKCIDKGLFSQCLQIPNFLRPDLYEKILTKHSAEHYEKLKTLCQSANLTTMEHVASEYDSVYFNNHTFDAACRALSSVLNLVLAVAKQDIMNGMAFVRPPGHHAMYDEFNGYCFFNNVAIAAEACIKENLAKRILIVDIDVHHGQGTQQMFYDRKDVLYFSVHRYEHGYFWPNLAESNFNYIGKGEGVGYNINVPLNVTGLRDDDYLAVVFYLLLPVAYEFNPDLVIISAGYDSCMGDGKGKMLVTPGFYSHLVSLLHGVAKGQIAVVLEGGYFIPTLSEAACLTLKTLIGGPCPLLDPIRNIHPSVIETIRHVRRALYGKWNCFDICEFVVPKQNVPDDEEDMYKIQYFGKQEGTPYATRTGYPENTVPETYYFARINKALQEKYRASVSLPYACVYDEKMLAHTPQRGDIERPERPERLTSIMKGFTDYGIDKRLLRTKITKHDWSVYSPHIPNYLEAINMGLLQSKDLYINEHTRDSVNTAVSGLLTVIDNVMNATCRGGVAVIRPPGHHAEHRKPGGFCFVNNVAVGANYLNIKYNMRRILIVDFDVHHGNGTQNMFYTDPHVLYISIHKDDKGKFFPPKSPRSYKHDGFGAGKGFNINIPFNRDKMGDTEYIAAFQHVVLPAAYSFAPQVILISAGFDAGINDPLGGYEVHPETFGHFIMMLRPLAEGRLILALEGGYNLTTTTHAMALSTKALLGDPIIMPKNIYKNFSYHAMLSIRDVMEHFKQYFEVFKVHKKLPNKPVIIRRIQKFTADTYARVLFKVLDPDRIDDNDYVETEMSILNALAC